MKQVILVPELRELLQSGSMETLRQFCERSHPATTAELLSGLEPPEIWQILQALPVALRAEIFSEFELDDQVALATGQNRRDMARLLEEMAADDRADLVLRLDEQVREELLPLVAKAEREDIRRLVSYEEGTAGSVMSTDYAWVRPEQTATEAIEQIRRQAPDSETIYYVYVVDDQRRLVGVVSLQDVILARPARTMRDILHQEVISVKVSDDQEHVAEQIQKYDLIAIPVVNDQNVLVGIVTHDDAMDILQEEQTEDMEKFMGISGEHQVGEYATSSVLRQYRRRVPWLLGLAALGTVSGLVMHSFEETLQTLLILAFYMPMVADTGGNTGAQAATLIIRAMTLGEVEPRNLVRMILREMRVALMLGVTIGAAVYLVVLLVSGVLIPTITGHAIHESTAGFSIFTVALPIAVALGLQVVAAVMIGIFLPLLASRFRLDPAVVASPAITTVVDITGLLIYFTTARLILSV